MSSHAASSSDDGSDDEDEDGGWLAQKFALGAPPLSARNRTTERAPLETSDFDASHSFSVSFFFHMLTFSSQDAFMPSDFPQRVRDTVNQFDDNFAFDVRS